MRRDDGDRPRMGSRIIPRYPLLALLILLLAVPPAAGEALQWLPTGGRVDALRLQSIDGSERYLAPQGGTVIVTWASWSPASIDVLKEVLPVARQPGMNWTVLPINVDAVAPDPAQRAQIGEFLRAETGFQDSVWFDPGLVLFDRWGIVAVPTVLITDAGGRAVLAERGWSADVRDRVLGYMGVGPLAGEARADTALLRVGGRMAHVLQQWRRGRSGPATRELSRIRRLNLDWAVPRVFAAFWCWDTGDTVCARLSAEAAVAADSTDPAAYTALAAIQLHHQHYDRAALLAGQAIATDSTFAPAWSLLARIAVQEGRDGDAWDALAVLGHLNPHHPAYDVVAALLHERQGTVDSALARWHRGLTRQLY